MATTITGLGSGFDIDGWVSQLVAAKKANTVTPLQSKLSTLNTQSSAVSKLQSKFNTLKSSLQAFTNTIYDSSSDMWTNTKITSSNDAYATATSSGVVSASSVNLEIKQIATATVAQSTDSLGAVTKEDIEATKFTNLANGQAKAGSFSMFLNNREYDIEIDSKDTVKDVLDKIYDASGGKIQASVDNNGIFTIQAYKEVDGNWEVDTDAKLNLGSSGDESNLVSALKLHDKIGEYGFKTDSKYPISTVNTRVAMSSEESGLNGVRFFDEEGADATEGTITINGVDIKVTSDMSLNDLVSRINANTDTHVKATYDSLTNKISLTATETGHSNISLSENGTNVLQKLNLLDEVDGEEFIKEGSQNLGQNAIVKINDNEVVSTSNTISGASSGIANLSITVKKVTGDKDGDTGEDSINLAIEPDYSKVKDSLTAFVNAYNDVVETTKKYTGSDGDIGHDISLTSILSSIKALTSKVNANGGAFSMLSDIGISTSKTDASKLSIDDTKLTKALSENFQGVKTLLSDGYTNKEDTGLFDGMYNSLSQILDTESGYFANKTSTIDSMIKATNSRIDKANDRLATYETRITKQFNKMDSVMASLSSQLSTFQAYLS